MTAPPHRSTIRVRYSETDRMGLLYHVTYYEYFEVARSDWIRNIWRSYREIEDDGCALVVVEASLKYHRPAHYDDLLDVEIEPVDWGHSRLGFRYAIYRAGEGEALCTGHTAHCFIDRSGKPVAMPAELRRRLDGVANTKR